MRFQNIPKTAKCRFYVVIIICLERSDILNLDVFLSPFGSLLESLFDTFGEKVAFGSSKTGVLKKHRKLMKTGHASTANFWLCAPKRDPRIQQLEAGKPRVLRLLSLAEISKKLTSKVQDF